MSKPVNSSIRRSETRKKATTPHPSVSVRQSILDEASGFLKDRPFRDLTVKELMLRVNASRPVFYLHFSDLYELMESLLDSIKAEILEGALPWLTEDGEPAALLRKSLEGLVEVGMRRGTLLRAVADASTTDEKLEQAWSAFLGEFDQIVTQKIEEQQAAGLTPSFSALPIARALNRLDAYLLIEQFGRHPQGDRDDVLMAITQIWISTLFSKQPEEPGDFSV